MIEKILLAIGVIALVGWFFLGIGEAEDPTWIVHADQPLVIGGYGDNYAYTGGGVRPLKGSLDLHLNLPQSEGTLIISLETTEESGSLRVSRPRS